MERALIIQEQHYGKNCFKSAATLYNLSKAYGALGSHDKQKELLERALIIQERHYGKDHPETRMTLINLKEIYKTHSPSLTYLFTEKPENVNKNLEKSEQARQKRPCCQII